MVFSYMLGYNQYKMINNHFIINDTINHTLEVNGFYETGEYFCVWTKNRELSEISRTTFHELAHVFIYRNPKHFCGDRK